MTFLTHDLHFSKQCTEGKAMNQVQLAKSDRGTNTNKTREPSDTQINSSKIQQRKSMKMTEKQKTNKKLLRE